VASAHPGHEENYGTLEKGRFARNAISTFADWITEARKFFSWPISLNRDKGTAQRY
jgi:hypothetical protein